MRLQTALLLLAPFALIGLGHYMRYAALTPAGSHDVLGRARAASQAKQQQIRFAAAHASAAAANRQRIAQALGARALGDSSRSSTSRTAVPMGAAVGGEVRQVESGDVAAKPKLEQESSDAPVKPKLKHVPLKNALSSEAATAKILESAGLSADSIEGLGEVTTAEEFVSKLPADAAVWLTFSNQAYLHFAQNWYMQVRAVGRQRQVVVAALDPFTLNTWRSLRVPVLNFTEFGDSSDFRGIGSDQARADTAAASVALDARARTRRTLARRHHGQRARWTPHAYHTRRRHASVSCLPHARAHARTH